jgi:protein involved in polysaccharide export with SLBB domain
MISGNAYKPGIYTIAGGSNMLQALSVAGGIGEHGSYRDIVLIRNNEVIERLDLYDVLINGIFSARTRLKSGDVILVKPVHNIVSVDGAVKRPAKYELLKDENLQTALDFANSINIDADLKNITLKRILDGNMEIIKIVNLRQFENINSVDGDAITIRRHPFRSVKINGAVLNPGTYSMSVGDTLRDLINKAGGYTQNAYPFGAIYENNDALEINEEAKDLLYVEFIDNIISTSQQNPAGTNGTDLKAIIEITKELKNASPNGRIVVDLLNEDSGTKFYIKDKDKLYIPEKPNHVYVFGEVSREGSVLFKEQNFNYYLNKSGGLKSTADKEAIFVLHPNGNTQRYKLNKNIFASSPQEVMLYPGSIIFVPRNVDDSVVRTLSAQAYVSILGNLGIALASLSNLND